MKRDAGNGPRGSPFVRLATPRPSDTSRPFLTLQDDNIIHPPALCVKCGRAFYQILFFKSEIRINGAVVGCADIIRAQTYIMLNSFDTVRAVEDMVYGKTAF